MEKPVKRTRSEDVSFFDKVCINQKTCRSSFGERRPRQPLMPRGSRPRQPLMPGGGGRPRQPLMPRGRRAAAAAAAQRGGRNAWNMFLNKICIHQSRLNLTRYRVFLDEMCINQVDERLEARPTGWVSVAPAPFLDKVCIRQTMKRSTSKGSGRLSLRSSCRIRGCRR